MKKALGHTRKKYFSHQPTRRGVAPQFAMLPLIGPFLVSQSGERCCVSICKAASLWSNSHQPTRRCAAPQFAMLPLIGPFLVSQSGERCCVSICKAASLWSNSHQPTRRCAAPQLAKLPLIGPAFFSMYSTLFHINLRRRKATQINHFSHLT